jgi:methionine-rich copper-binding protein CopC
MRVALAWLLLWGSSGALAHAHLQGSSPVDGSHLSAAPAVLVLSFSESARLTALSLESPDGKRTQLVAPAEPQARISVPLPSLTPGTYVVYWRALAADGHLVPGQIRFTISR